ncbi:MAG: TRAP transporter substrate-binding protein DctP [Deltaproteobacteria bacterium]|nr:TRAP transporter substrate-binding protein DctP [Deltaproteobacteria bacterium]
MKRKKFFKPALVVCLLILFTMFMASWAAAKSPKKIEWTFNQMALGKWLDNKVFGEWLPTRLEEATGGRLVLHTPINLVPLPEVLHAVRDGMIQGAFTGTPYYSGEWPLGSFHAIPGVLKTDDEYPAVGNAVVWPYWEKSLWEKYKIHVLGLTHWPGINLYCNEPIRTVADFKGKKLRGMGYYDSLAFEEIGAAGLSVPWDEAFLAVQRGVVDGLVTGLVVYDSMGFWEYAKYINKFPIHGSSCAAFIIVNGKAFDSLPADIKPVVKKVFKEAADRVAYGNIELVDDSLKSLLKRGVKVIQPSDDQIRKCLEMAKGVRAKWLEQCKKSGSPEAEEMLMKIEAFLAGYRAGKSK